MRIYGYLRASTKEQDAKRAKSILVNFSEEMGQSVSTWFVENESGAVFTKTRAFRLLDVAQPADIL